MGIGNSLSILTTLCRMLASLPLMGIGNFAAAYATELEAIAHYPSWGLETHYRVGHRPGGCVAHYPSWGLETASRGRASFSTCPHYPSWGLETPGGRAEVRRHRRLITPHGDWKPISICRGPAAPARSHYPSWGLETASRTCARLRAVTSLPLMGIGNARSSSSAPRISRTHYPSWGLETLGIRWGRGSASGLITPHGDWKRRSLRPSGWNLVCSHYPSWGLETHRRPHGRRHYCAAHYPSWGLETSVTTGGDCAQPASLPLMGIGNLRAPSPERRLVNPSLPLMGIGNSERSTT